MRKRPLGKIAPILFTLLCVTAAHSAAAQTPDGEVDRWSGEAALSGNFESGSSSSATFAAEFNAKRRLDRIEHEFDFSASIRRERGSLAGRRITGGVQSNLDVGPRAYVFAFARAQADRSSGFRYEVEAGPGVGYRLFETEDLDVNIETGIGFRYSEAEAPRADRRKWFWRGSSDIEYRMSEQTTFTDEFLVTYDAINTRIENTAAISTRLVGRVVGRVSFSVRHDTDPPIGITRTNTFTRISLVYGF